MPRGPADDDDDDLPLEITADVPPEADVIVEDVLPEILELSPESGPVTAEVPDEGDVPPEDVSPEILELSPESGPVTAEVPAQPPPSPGSPASFSPSALLSSPASSQLEPGAEIDLYLAEAELADAARAAPLIHQAANLRDTALGDGGGALAAQRAALTRDPTFVAPLGPLRQLLVDRGAWDELAAVYEKLIRAGTFSPDARRSRRVADLWIERGRILGDRLSRPDQAAVSYREATVASPDHAAAQLARLIEAARARDEEGVEAALAGLIDCADEAEQRAALAAELARVQRLAPTTVPASAPAADAGAGGPASDRAGPARALATLRQALAGLGEGTSAAGLVGELEELARLHDHPVVQVGALEELVRAPTVGPAATRVALHRERARILRDVLHDLEGAHAALAEARRLIPEHPLLTTDMLDVADQLGSVDLLAKTVETSAIPQDELLSAARLVEALRRAGKANDALELVRKYGDGWAADPSSSSAIAALVSRIALHAETGDAIGLADAFETEGERGQGIAAAHAMLRAATLRELVLHDARHAETLYRKALTQQPGYAPAVDALEELLRADARWEELAELLGGDLAALAPGDAQAARRRYLLEALVGLHRDRLASPARALVFQRERVALDPSDLHGWMVKRDLELAVSIGPGDPEAKAALRREGVTTLIDLAARAGVPAVTAALENEAAALVTDDPGLALQFFRDAAVDDRTGIAAGNLAAQLTTPAERCRALSAELTSADAAGRGEVARGLRYRLSAERARAGEWKESVAALVPVGAAGDELARAVSLARARQSGEASLEVAVRGDEAATDGSAGLVAAADLGEALERAGNGGAAQQAFREALRRERSTDAALGLLRTASVAGNLEGVAEALRAIGDISLDDGGATIAAAATREAELLDAARGVATARAPGAPRDVDDALREWLEGVRRRDQRQVAGALVDLATIATGAEALTSTVSGALLVRAAARSRLAGREVAGVVHRRAWAAAPGNAALAHAISDLRAGGGLSEGSPLPDVRAERATQLPATLVGLATELDLERALEQEGHGRLGEALDVYGRILARDPDCLEAMLGVRRLARAGGDALGEARALVRLGALVKTPAHVAAFFMEAAPLYERAGHREQAIAAYLKILEHTPDDEAGFHRLVELLRAGADAPGNAKTLDRVLGHRLHRRGASADADEVIALLVERADNRWIRLEDRENAAEDFKRILKLDPGHARALRQLATLAIEMQHPADAARFLERYLGVVRDEASAATARLELATAREEAGDRPGAIEALRAATAARPLDVLPLQRLTDLHSRAGDWKGAIAGLRAWESLVDDPAGKAGLQLRLGALLRDDAYDLPQAAVAFRRAAELDPLGDGTRELALLHESTGDETGRVGVMEQAIAETRAALTRDPLQVPRLRRLVDLLEGAWPDGRGRDATEVVAQVLGLLDELPPGTVPVIASPRPLAAPLPNGFWAALADPPALGFMTEVWLLLADAILEMHPPDIAALGAVRQTRILPEGQPEVGWILDAAATLGLPSLLLYRAPGAAGREVEAQPVEFPAPGLVLGASSTASTGSSRFWIGRALGLLRYRATAVARLPADELQAIFSAAGVIAGASPEAAGGRGPRATEAQVKALSKALARKDRKALGLQASRFGFETVDATAWKTAILRTADRLGLVLAGDARAAATALAGLATPVAAAGLRQSDAALDLLRFALGEGYLTARREAGQRGGH